MLLSSIETELRSRARPLGVFAASSSIARMRYAILRAAMWLANMRDWDYLNQTSSLSTTLGNLGPYAPPSGLLRLALHKQVSVWGYAEKDVLAPILSTDTVRYRPFIKIEDGQLYFFDDPGDATHTLNYVAEVEDDVAEGALTTTVEIIPSGLKSAVINYAMGDLWDDLPRGESKAQALYGKARSEAEEYWHQSTLAQAQRGISPKGLRGQSIDNHAAGITILGTNANRWIDSDT